MNLLTLGAKRPAFQCNVLGLPVRVYAHFLVLAALLGTLAGGGLVGMAAGAGVVFLVVLGHELGHAAAEQAFGLRPTIDLVWFGGATSEEGVHALSRLRRIAVAAAGPLAGALVGGLAWQLGADRTGIAGGAAEVGYQVGVVWGLANLLPIWPMDGGHLLVDLLPGRVDTRRRITYVVSMVLAAAASLVALVLFELPFLAAFSGGFAYLNLHMLRNAASTARAEQSLRDTLGRLSTASAAEAERTAREVLGAGPHASVAMAAADLVVASHLVRGDDRQARVDLSELSTTWIWPALRDLVVLGDSAGPELDRRLAAEPTDHDVRMAALHRSFRGDHADVAQLATSSLAPALDGYTAHFVQMRAFHAGAFEASIAIGQAAEALPDVQPHIPFNVACGWTKLGDTQAAFAALERAAAAGWTDVHAMDADEDLSPLRGLAAYKDVRRRVSSGRRSRPNHADGYRRSGAVLGLAGCLAVAAGLVAGLPDAGRPRTARFEVLALDAATGVARWRIDMEGQYAGVVASGDVLVANGFFRSTKGPNGTMSIVDPIDGRTITSVAGTGSGAARTRDGGAVVGHFHEGTHFVRAIDARTGMPRWVLETAFGSPRVAGDVVVLSALDDIGMQGVDAGSGSVLWTRGDLRPLEGSAPELVLGESANGHLIVSLDPRTGAERWRAIVDGTSLVLERHIWVDESAQERMLIDMFTGAPSIVPVVDVAAEPLLELDGRRAVLATGDAISVIDLPSGDVRWERPARARAAIAVDGSLVIASSQGVEAYDVDTGDRLWTSADNRPRLSTAGSTVLVISSEELRAVDPRRGTVLWTEADASVPMSSDVFGDLVVMTHNPGRGRTIGR